MKNLALTLFMACVFSALAIAQDKTTPISSSHASSDDTKVVTKYDKSKDETTIEFSALEIAHSDEQQVFLSVTATFTGSKPKARPEDLMVILSVESKSGYRYPDIMALEVVADGKKLPPVIMLNLDKRRMGQDYLETIGTRMKYAIFKSMADARTIVLHLRSLSIQLDETQIAKLHELDTLLPQQLVADSLSNPGQIPS